MDKIAIVTGGATGIGKACVVKLNTLGYKVILAYFSSEDKAKEIEKELSNIIIKKVDVRDEKSIKKLYRFVESKYGKFDALINNAGGYVSSNQSELYPIEDWNETYNINVRGVFLMCKYGIPILNDNGRIINISSMSAMTGGKVGGMAYASAKSAVDGITKSLAKELADRNILVNSVSPGVILTDLHKTHSTKIYLNSLAKQIPLKRLGLTSEVANLVAFLCSDESSYITGQVIGVNGGFRV